MKITDIKINLIEGANTQDAQQFVGGNSKVILRVDTDAVSYTHLTLPTIYSV